MSEPYPEHDWTGAGSDEEWDLFVYVAGSSPKGKQTNNGVAGESHREDNAHVAEVRGFLPR